MARRRTFAVSNFIVGAAALASAGFAGSAAAAPRGIYPFHGPESPVADSPAVDPFTKHDAGGGGGGGGGTGSSCTAGYFGGPVLANVHVVPVFWTSSVDSTVKAWAPGYLGTITNSTFLDMLSEYSTQGKTGTTGGTGSNQMGPGGTTNQTVTRGDVTTAYTITPTVATGTSVDDSNIGPELQSQITAGHLPAPEYDSAGYPNTLYFIFFPPGTSITMQNASSCASGGFCGYHMSYNYTAPAGEKGAYIPYAVIPDMGSGSGCDQGCASSTATTDTDIMTGTVSHELAEAITDTDDGNTDLGWYITSSSCAVSGGAGGSGEIGDVCAAGSASAPDDVVSVPGTSISAQHVWSNALNGCAVTNPAIGDQPDPAGGGGGGTTTPDASSGGGGTTKPDAGSGGGGGGSTPDASSGGGGGGGGGSTPDASSGGGGGGGGIGGSSSDAGGGGPTWNPDAGSTTPPPSGGTDGGTGGNGETPGSPTGGSSGSGCDVAPGTVTSGIPMLGMLFGLALLGGSRRKRQA